MDLQMQSRGISVEEVKSNNIYDPKQIKDSFLKKYSSEELTVLAKIPRLYRNKRAFRYTQDIIHINPEKVSKANMNHLIKHQLLEGTIGLSAEEKLKKGDKLLTREEKKLYDAILKTQWTLKHITFDYDVIKEKGNILKSLQQRMRENNSLDNSHALQGTGKDDNVFFTLGSPQHKGAGFLHGKGGNVISLDVNHFSEDDRLKEALSGLQLSDHWFQYLNQGYFSQTYGNTKREIKFFNDTGESFTLKGHKIYSYYRHDGNVLTRTVSLGQEVVTGAEVFPFIAYNLILELRYIGGQYRQHLFNHLEKREIVEAAIDSFYHSSNFEATIPSQMNLNYPHIMVTPQDINPANTVNNALLMHEAISERKIDKIKTLLAVGVSIDILDDKGVTPLIKALSTYRYDMAYFLIDNGANLGLTYQKYSALAISIIAGRMDIVEKILSKQIIVDDRDSTIFRQVDINRDIKAISAGISKGYLSHFLRVGLNVEKFSPYIMFLLTEGMLSEKMAIHSINLLVELQRGFRFNYGKNRKSDHYFSLTLLNAIHQQKLTLIEHLIKWGCRLNATTLYSDHQWVDITPLMLAVRSGNLEIVETLVKSGADINKYDKNGRTALMLAEEMKYQDIIKFLKYQSHEPKNDSVAAHKKEIAKALIYSKSSKSGKIYFLVGQKRNKKYYELFSLDSSKQTWKSKSLEELARKAVYSGALIDLLPHIDNGNVQKKLFDRHDFRKSNTDLVIETHEYLVDDLHKLKPYPSDEYGDVRWISASNISNRHNLISKYDYPMIKSLMKNQPFNGQTYLYRLFELNAQLFVAIKKNSCGAVEKLLVAGADANGLSDKNLTPLAITCDTPHPNLALIQILIQHGALLNHTCCYETITCDTHHPNLTVIRTLIQHDALLNQGCFYEMRELVPLQLAMLQKSNSLISLLCENGANPNQKLGTSMTPLLTACGLGDIKLIEELISYGADFKTDENKGILARLCAIPCTDDLFDYLLDHADINGLSTQFQYTPLMVCAKLGDINRIKKLLAKGADPSIRHPCTFKSASDLALEEKNCNVVDLLRESSDISQKGIGELNDYDRYFGSNIGSKIDWPTFQRKGRHDLPWSDYLKFLDEANEDEFELIIKTLEMLSVNRDPNIWEKLPDKKLLELVTYKHSPIKKEIIELPAELAEYTNNGDYTEWQKSKIKIFKILVNRSLLQANIFNKTTNFEVAFKEFYDKNINHLRLFRDIESSKIFNLDNNAVHILLEKFSDIAQSGTEEEKKLVKSFFLNRDDHRDLSHLQKWSNFPPILPCHIPYIKFVMEQEYHGKEFQLFSLSEISKFYRSSDVTFYHEVPVQIWLKIVQIELPFSDFSIDTLVTAIPLLDNLCGDKSVLKKIFKQYMDTFDQLPVLSQEAATLVRLVLIFFNSSGSSLLKKSLLDKLNWNQLSEMNIECRLAVEDIIFLYRIHNATLKFPSVEKQKLLGNLVLEKIKNISLVNDKITLLEQLMFTKKGYFNSPLADSVFRNEVIALWTEVTLIKYGPDDASYAFYHRMKEIINRINSEASARDKCCLFQQLANSIETQSGLSTYMGEIISPTETKDSIQEKNVVVIALGNELKMISKTEANKVKTLDFLSSPLTAASLDIAVEHAMTIHNRDGIKELVKQLCSCGDDYSRQYNKNDVKNALMMTYHQFWDLDLEERAGVINYLLIPSDKIISLKDKREAYDQAFHYAVHKLFPNAQSDEQENFSKSVLMNYLQTADEYKCEYLLAGIIFTSNEADSDGKAPSPVRKLALLCKHLGPAYVKLAQAIHSHPRIPENIRRDLDLIKGRVTPPYRWDLWRLMDIVLPINERKNIARVGSLLGSVSYNLVIECKLKNRDEQVVLLLLRDNAAKDASDGFTPLRSFSPLDHVTNFMSFGLFATRRDTKVKTYNDTKSQQQNTLQNKQIFVTTALRNLAFTQEETGDKDYANTSVNSLKEQSLERLQTFKDKGGYVVVTVIKFAKHAGRHNFNLKFDTITLMEKADYAFFLDKNDQKNAIEFAEKMRKKIPPSQVISVPATVPVANKALPERGKDIISFGIIRVGKGLAHVRKLAKLMKESNELSIQGKKILVVGTVDQGQEDKWDRTLYDLMREVYPGQAKAMNMKKPYELVALLKEIQSDLGIKPALPIEIHLNVAENELSKLFDRCTYSYLPGHRGATLRDSSISSSLTNQFVTYVHEGKNTPEFLKAGGLYQDAVSMIKYDPEKDFYCYSAQTVLADIVKREKDPKLNVKTMQATSKLVNEQLSLLSVIASQHDEIYSKGISLEAMKNYPFYYLQEERSLTIPRREIAYPLPKRYLGFNRLSQTLRHVSSVVFRTVKKELRCNPKEVQVAMLVNELHISSNFHSDKLASALVMAVMAMIQDSVIEKKHVAKCDKKAAKFDHRQHRHNREHRQRREHRHLISLKQFLLNDHIFDTTVDKGITEIKQGLGIPQNSNLSVDEITSQFIIHMKTLRSVLQRCSKGDSFGVIVHSPPKDDTVINALLKNGETATRHAERNIVQYLNDNAGCIYNKSLDSFSLRVGKHVLVPMEGRFVPCGFCYEQEAVEQMPGKGGLFDPIQERFLLHRSSYRAGKFFAREIQFFTFSSFHSDPAEARDRSVQILENIARSSPQLSIYGRPIVRKFFFNTDSEDSNEDDQI